jgi:hypothetical protein
VSFGKVPAVALMHPPVGDPALTSMRALPMAADPLVPTADPVPVAADPYKTGLRRRTVFLHSGRRRLHRDDAANIVAMGWWDGDDAAAQCDPQYGNCYQISFAKTKLSHMHSKESMMGRSIDASP